MKNIFTLAEVFSPRRKVERIGEGIKEAKHSDNISFNKSSQLMTKLKSSLRGRLAGRSNPAYCFNFGNQQPDHHAEQAIVRLVMSNPPQTPPLKREGTYIPPLSKDSAEQNNYVLFCERLLGGVLKNPPPPLKRDGAQSSPLGGELERGFGVKSPLIPLYKGGTSPNPSPGRGKKAAFTLAETLITLGIIGVVAAITMPVIVSKYKKTIVVSRLKKTYSTVSQAMLMACPYGDYANIPVTNGGKAGVDDFFNNYLKQYFNIAKLCSFGISGCMDKVTAKSGAVVNLVASDRINFITADGIAINLDTWDAKDYITVSNKFGVDIKESYSSVVIFVDVNGNKSPNIFGNDVFCFVLTNKGLTPAGSSKSDDEVKDECKTTGYYCFSKIIRDGWQIKDDYPW